MIRRPPRSTPIKSSAASDVYKRQVSTQSTGVVFFLFGVASERERTTMVALGIKWGIRLLYVLILLAIFFIGILVSFMGLYDPPNYRQGQKELITVKESDYGPIALYNTQISFSGVLGVYCTVNGTTVSPALLSRNRANLTDGDDIPIKVKYLAKTDNIIWYEVDMSEEDYIVVALVISTLSKKQPFEIYLYETKDLRLVPRIVGPVVWGIFFILCIVFEWRLWVYEKKYGEGSAAAKTESKRKTRFFG
eukprot:TRINITY_DN1051_c0_g1_i1.p1 TRINITY_DN1051_c0_g1~~TRINITY_DN1051_c0_g1_i1.p1  ORF type:complete len:249 (+),score=57.79 TRINITY_DN1051_c0_g1_i1:2-748(+)